MSNPFPTNMQNKYLKPKHCLSVPHKPLWFPFFCIRNIFTTQILRSTGILIPSLWNTSVSFCAYSPFFTSGLIPIQFWKWVLAKITLAHKLPCLFQFTHSTVVISVPSPFQISKINLIAHVSANLFPTDMQNKYLRQKIRQSGPYERTPLVSVLLHKK